MGTHQNRVDSKGRVSIPAAFRAAMKAVDGRETVKLILRPSHNYTCVEAWPEPAFRALEAPLKTLAMFSEEYDDLASALYTDAQTVESDKEGRIAMPDALASFAGLTDTMVFMGFGERFHIWEPQAAAEYKRAQDEKRAQQKRRITVPGVPMSPAGAPQ